MSTTLRSLLRVTRNANVPKLAGAIAHSIRAQGEVDVQAIGAAAVNQSIKAIALAQSFLNSEGTDLLSIPQMVSLHEEGQERTAVRISVTSHTNGKSE
ncbi:MAG: stage V sporulation protein S [Caldilineaceae bacterium]|nr:stage V sporulation protein S [Caldilineaceae bacterium]